MYRQGDISLRKIEKLPEGTEKAMNNVLAYGEVTGHEHRIDSEEVVVYIGKNGRKYVQLLKQANLIHDTKTGKGITEQVQAEKEDKHLVIQITPGTYAVQHEREYDVFGEVIRQVTD